MVTGPRPLPPPSAAAPLFSCEGFPPSSYPDGGGAQGSGGRGRWWGAAGNLHTHHSGCRIPELLPITSYLLNSWARAGHDSSQYVSAGPRLRVSLKWCCSDQLGNGSLLERFIRLHCSLLCTPSTVTTRVPEHRCLGKERKQWEPVPLAGVRLPPHGTLFCREG